MSGPNPDDAPWDADDWEPWLVYADRLLEAGDERGELLILESGGASFWELEARLDAWLWDQAPRGDREVVDWLWDRHEGGELLALYDVARLPHLLRPRTRTACALVPGERSARLFGWVEETLQQAVAMIDAAFDGVPHPDRHHRTLRQAEAADDYDSCDQSEDPLGRWQDLPDAYLLDNQWALAHLDAQGVHHYFPAVMCFALRHEYAPHPDDGWLTESLCYSLHRPSAELRDYHRQRFERFTTDQRRAVAVFCAVTRNGGMDNWLRSLAPREGDDWVAELQRKE